MALILIILSYALAAITSVIVKNRRVMELTTIGANAVAVVSSSIIAYGVGTHGTYSRFGFASVDALGAIILVVISLVGLAAAIYGGPYLRKELTKHIIGQRRFKEYYVLVNLFLTAMFLSASASHPVMSWIFLEATTISTAFLISYYNTPATIEAAWKYLIVNSTGLLIGFLGALLYFTALPEGAAEGIISWGSLTASAGHLNPTIAKVAFIFVLIGYGTKVGLAPMHTWKPDAYSKSPSTIGALFSGALMPVAFVTILRFKSVTDTAIGQSFSQHLMITFGLISIIVAALSILTVKNYKRMLAYSSIEHAGIMALGFGFGGLGAFAAVLHMIYHSLVKAALFFASGNLLLKFNSAHISGVKGALRALPVTSILFLVGFLAATGMPPFGIFTTELLALSSGIEHYWIVVAVALLAMAVLFVGFLRQTSDMVFGAKPKEIRRGEGSVWLLVPPIALLLIVVVLSFYMPPFMQTLIHEVAQKY